MLRNIPATFKNGPGTITFDDRALKQPPAWWYMHSDGERRAFLVPMPDQAPGRHLTAITIHLDNRSTTVQAFFPTWKLNQ